MLIVAGYVELHPSERERYVAAHRDLVSRARAAEGCLDLAISADPVRDGRVNLFERWESRAALDAWRPVSRAPDLKVDYLGGDVMMYHVDGVTPAFG